MPDPKLARLYERATVLIVIFGTLFLWAAEKLSR